MTPYRSPSPYITRPIETDDDSLRALCTLFGKTLGAMKLEYLTWLYRDNPNGHVVGFNAYEGAALAAHYATIPLVSRFNGRDVKGVLSLNTATHPDHQGKGLFTRLANETYAHAASRGYEFVVGVANANSTPGFTKKLGFQLVTPLDVLVGVGSPQSGSHEVGFAVVWPTDSLRWRLRRPRAGYVAEPHGKFRGIYAPTHKLGIQAYMGHVHWSLAQALPVMSRSRPLRMWIGVDPGLQKNGVLVPLPDRFKPSPLNLIFRDLTTQGRQLSRDTTRFTLMDFDAY